MAVSVAVCAFACALLIVLVLFKPSVKLGNITLDIYWLPAFAGGLFLILSGNLSFEETWSGLTASGEMNPIKILSLFLSLTFLSVFLDELGFFAKLASLLVERAKGSQKKLFLCLYLLVSVLTVFTSNDVVVLTFTPFICCFCKEERISPIPYLIGEFVAANTWSMFLVIGNPTNIYLATSFGIGFGEYFSKMWLATLFSGTAALGVLWLLFSKKLGEPMSPSPRPCEVGDKGLTLIGTLHLALCVVLLALSSYLPIPMWGITVGFAVSLILTSLVYSACKKNFSFGAKTTMRALARAPWTLVPFVLSMFVIVLSMQKVGVTDKIAELIGGEGKFATVFSYGTASYLASNLINNIPMSVLFSGVLTSSPTTFGTYAAVVGSNLGAYLTPIGALAGIMWTGLLKKYDVKFSFRTFILYGILLSLPALVFALLGLTITL